MLFESNTMYLLLKTIISVLTALGMMLVMTDFKFSSKQVAIIFSIYLIYVLFSTKILISLLGWTHFLRYFILTISVPAVLVTYFIAKDSPMQAVFNYMTQINVTLIIGIVITLLNQIFVWNLAIDILVRSIIGVTMILLEYHYLRNIFRRIAECLHGHWLSLALIPVTFCVMIVVSGLFPIHYTQNKFGVIQLGLVAILMCIVYVVVFQSLLSNYQLFEVRMEKDILDAQINAQKQHYEAKLGNEQEIRRMCHNMKGQLATALGLLTDGETIKAKEYLSSVSVYYQNLHLQVYCDDPYLNAAINIFASQYVEQNVQFTHDIQLNSVELPPVELCLILNNALQNSLDAVIHLPVNDRTVKMQATIKQGQFLLRVSNPFVGNLHIKKGHLISSKPIPGHGYGLSTIQTVTQRLNGSIEWNTRNNIFTLDIRIPIIRG